MLSVTRHRVEPPRAEEFLQQARLALEALRVRPGFQSGSLARATDDAELFVVVTSWADIGSYRRALSAMDVRLAAVPLLSTTLDEASAFEPLLEAGPETMVTRGSDRAEDADRGDRLAGRGLDG